MLGHHVERDRSAVCVGSDVGYIVRTMLKFSSCAEVVSGIDRTNFRVVMVGGGANGDLSLPLVFHQGGSF